MGLQIYTCKFCKHQFGWCSVGGFSSWGEHEKHCKALELKFEEWAVYPDYDKIIKH